MNISERASKYLKNLKRDKNWTSDFDETKKYLVSRNIHPNRFFLRYQKLYSGYKLTIKDDPGHSFSAFLFSNKQIRNNESLEIDEVENKLLVDCGEHATAQFRFYITDKGEICTLDHYDSPNIIHSSFDKMLEQYAIRNEISNWTSHSYFFDVEKLESLTNLLNNEFQIITEASDEYSTWWKKLNLIAVKGIWLDKPKAYFHVYGTTKNECNDLIGRLKTQGLLK